MCESVRFGGWRIRDNNITINILRNQCKIIRVTEYMFETHLYQDALENKMGDLKGFIWIYIISTSVIFMNVGFTCM